jgi:hypothetical protein
VLNYRHALMVVVAAFYAYLVFYYQGQPLLEHHAFRQTQTALTSFWFLEEGFRLNYQTPVGGSPWMIPMEFPLYQALSALLSQIFSLDLSVSGRLLSVFFFLLTLLPIREICRSLNLPRQVFQTFFILIFASPVYVYWSRTFMIESAALFFSVTSIKYFLDARVAQNIIRPFFLFFLFTSLALLQKITTGLPVLLGLWFLWALDRNLSPRKLYSAFLSPAIRKLFLGSILACAIGYGWVAYADFVKSQGFFGNYLTSEALAHWNWGTFQQRFSFELWVKVIGGRTVLRNLGSVFGLSVLMFVIFRSRDVTVWRIIIASVVFYMMPLLLFPNLHIVHDYYQYANIIFPIFLLACCLELVLPRFLSSVSRCFVILLILSSNWIFFNQSIGYFQRIKNEYTETNTGELSLGALLNETLSQDGQFVLFGNDWSSTISFYSKRKSFTVPPWLGVKYDQVVDNPERYVDPDKLQAVVACGQSQPDLKRLFSWTEKRSGWALGIEEVSGCRIARAASVIDGPKVGDSAVDCIGTTSVSETEFPGLFKLAGRIDLLADESLPSLQNIKVFWKSNQGSKHSLVPVKISQNSIRAQYLSVSGILGPGGSSSTRGSYLIETPLKNFTCSNR